MSRAHRWWIVFAACNVVVCLALVWVTRVVLDLEGEAPMPFPVIEIRTATDEWYDFDFDQTHIFVLVGGVQLPYDFEISTRVQYVTGNPWTPYAGGIYDIDQGYYWGYSTAAYNSERLPPYFATDVRLEKLFTFRRWQLAAAREQGVGHALPREPGVKRRGERQEHHQLGGDPHQRPPDRSAHGCTGWADVSANSSASPRGPPAAKRSRRSSR